MFRAWQRNLWMAIFVGINLLLPGCLTMAAMVAAFDDEWPTLLVGALLIVGYVLAVLRALIGHVSTRDGIIRVRNPLRSYSFPASDVDGISLRRLTVNEAAVRLHRRRGRDVTALAVPVGRYSMVPRLLDALESGGAPATIRTGPRSRPGVRTNY